MSAARVVDPLGGSYYIERLTTDIEDEARALIERIDDHGGLVEAIKSEYAGQLIANSSWDQQRAIESGDRTVVASTPTWMMHPEMRVSRSSSSIPGCPSGSWRGRTRASRSSPRVREALREVRRLADVEEANLMPAILVADHVRVGRFVLNRCPFDVETCGTQVADT